MIVEDRSGLEFAYHQLPWSDFDSLARGDGGAEVIRQLRRSLRSRRLLMLRTLVDEVADVPDLYSPLPTPDQAWDLLARAQAAAPDTVEHVLAHPYTGAWLAYTRRLVNKIFVDSVCPLWIHVGHFHAMAAAAAIRAKINFEARIPVRNGEAHLPTLGTARLKVETPWSVATVRGDGETVWISTADAKVVLPRDPAHDAESWWGVRRLVTQEVNQRHLDIRLDDLDPYRGLHEPALADRMDDAEIAEWKTLLDDAWRLIAECVPEFADGFAFGFDSLVPRPEVPFRYMSGSTGETFGSAVIAKPPNAQLLAAALVHEFQHSRLHALMHLTRLHEPDSSQRYYTLWRDDPRPVGGVIHGVFAFFGMTTFWRALTATRQDRRGLFELAYCRLGTWQTLQELRRDPMLTPVGRRFVDGIAERLVPWLEDSISDDIAGLATTAAADHYAGWRLRHIQPADDVVAQLAAAWRSGSSTLDTVALPPDPAPVPEAEGSWPGARTELIRITLSDPAGTQLPDLWPQVPGVTAADFAYVSGDLAAAIKGYREEIREDPDRVSAWAGLGVALSTMDSDSFTSRVMLTHPELIRAVYMELCRQSGDTPAPDELAAWMAPIVLQGERAGSQG